MTDLVIREATGLQAQTITEDLYRSFLSYLDASPKTVETYSKALRQLFRYLGEQGIGQPTREDILAFREALKEDHKPSTIQTYIIAVRLFFQWTAQEGLYPDVAQHI